jgi:hypothetical protein
MQIKKKSEYSNKLNVENFTTAKKLREENKSNDLFEIMVGNITLEELIALKLELTYKNIGTPFYGIPLFRVLHTIVQDAVFKFACSVTPSKYKARIFLGMDNKQFYSMIKRYNTEEYFLPKEKKGDDSN